MPDARPESTLLRPDNFTPRNRTPWGGTRIVKTLKPDLPFGLSGESPVVGESWELSVEPDFPSFTSSGVSLDTIIREDPRAWLGPAASDSESAEILIKLLDSADDLSVQIHPSDTYPALANDEGGKPESWYIVDADVGACIYLGLEEGVSEGDLRRALTDGSDVSKLLTRIAVRTGDFFVIGPGTPHAIGRGCLLVEPQRVTPKKRGVTYRFWDWNRRYDASGRLDPNGAPRSLHVEHALAVTDFDAPRGEKRLDSTHRYAGPPNRTGPARRVALAGGKGGIASTDLFVERLEGTGSLAKEQRILLGLVVLDGLVRVRDGERTLVVERGRTAAIPAESDATFELDGAHAIVAGVPSRVA